MFYLIFLGVPFLNFLWWRIADKHVRAIKGGRKWRVAIAVFALAQFACFISVIISRRAGLSGVSLQPVLAASLIWFLLVLPSTMIVVFGAMIMGYVRRIWRRASRYRLEEQMLQAASRAHDDSAAAISRRTFLAATVGAVPPTVMTLATARAMAQSNDLRVRTIEVTLPNLPPALDGTVIAHVSDVHLGKFTRGRFLDTMVERTNELNPDLIAVTGDLIDFSMDELPAGLNLLHRLKSRYGLYMCEGNHDLFEDRTGFEEKVKASGINLLLNEEATLELRGENVQLLGLAWGDPSIRRDPFIAGNMDRVTKVSDSDAFRILLAHHPHAFDPAVAQNIPLVLSGHTHGGQLMLTDALGAGPAMYRYWSGLYEKSASKLVVSNGVGNWFPLRINAPAEIIRVVLRKA